MNNTVILTLVMLVTLSGSLVVIIMLNGGNPPSNAEVQIPDWVRDNIVAESDSAIVISTGVDEEVWLMDHGYKYCGESGPYTYITLAKPGHSEVC